MLGPSAPASHTTPTTGAHTSTSRRGAAGGAGGGGGANPVGNPSEGAQIIGSDLYDKLQSFLESYLNRLLKVDAHPSFAMHFFTLFAS